MNRYECEWVEATVCDMDLLLDGSMEQVPVGVDDDGELLYKEIVCIEAVYPVVLRDGEEQYSDYPLTFYPVTWKDTLLNAVRDRAEGDWEASQVDPRER